MTTNDHQNRRQLSSPGQKDQRKKREYTRVEVSLPAHLGTAAGDVPGEVKNISFDGALVIVQEPPPLQGVVFDLTIEIPEHHYALLTKAEIIRVDIYQNDDATLSYGLGVRFVEISAEDTEFLARTVLR